MKIRPVEAADLPLITQGFVRYGSDALAPLERDGWPRAAERLIEGWVRRGAIRVVGDPEGSDLVLAWAAYEGGALYWVWVRGGYRKAGIASAFVRELGPVESVAFAARRWQREAARRRGWRFAPRVPWIQEMKA